MSIAISISINVIAKINESNLKLVSTSFTVAPVLATPIQSQLVARSVRLCVSKLPLKNN